MQKIIRFLTWCCLLTSLLLACADPFAYSPFEADVSETRKNTTEKNLQAISEIDTVMNGSFVVALLSDSHYHFKDLEDAIDDINKKDIYSFIVVTGDITENGLLKEYEIFHNIMSNVKIPWLTVIGNHDHLSNGTLIYQQMFGNLNYTFSFRNTKFVAWDNTIWESGKEADYEWLERALNTNAHEQMPEPPAHTILFSHIPPFDYQLQEKAPDLNRILKKYGVAISVHGHKHDFFAGDLFGDGMVYATVGSPQNRNYAELHVTPDSVAIIKVNY